MSKYNKYLKSLELKECTIWDINKFAFKYLFKRLKYLEKEQHLLYTTSIKTQKEKAEYFYKDWLFSYEIKRTIKKIQDIQHRLLIDQEREN